MDPLLILFISSAFIAVAAAVVGTRRGRHSKSWVLVPPTIFACFCIAIGIGLGNTFKSMESRAHVTLVAVADAQQRLYAARGGYSAASEDLRPYLSTQQESLARDLDVRVVVGYNSDVAEISYPGSADQPLVIRPVR